MGHFFYPSEDGLSAAAFIQPLGLIPHHPLSLPGCIRGLRVIHEGLFGALSSWWQLCSSSGAWIFSPILSLLLYPSELWLTLLWEMPLQSSWMVRSPKAPSEPSIQTKSSKLCLPTPSNGNSPDPPSRAVLYSPARFS